MSLYRTYAEIDLTALQHNFNALAAKLPPQTKICTVVKADAYGHGFLSVCNTLSARSDYFAVAAAEEGAAVRDAGFTQPVLILGPLQPAEYRLALQKELTVSVFRYSYAKRLSDEALACGKQAHVHIAVDTGMSRIGLFPDPAGVREVMAIAALPGISVDGMFTHFYSADENDPGPALEQYKRFLAFRDALESEGVHIPVCHAANTAGVIQGIGTELDMVRFGIGLYGIYPSDQVSQLEGGLLPVMSVRSHLSYIKTIPKGAAVSYGACFRAPEDMRIGTVSAGYADGYAWTLWDRRPEVLIRGKRVPVLGRICMDQFMVSLKDVPEAEEGDIVTLLGRDGAEEISAEEMAEKRGTSPYEVLCGFTARVERHCVQNA